MRGQHELADKCLPRAARAVNNAGNHPMRFRPSARRLKIFPLREIFSTAAILFVVPAVVCAAAPGEYLIQTWDTSSSLPHNTVRAIAQTPDGYLWIGTENGLARFDGVRFENFARENTPALPNPNVDFLQVDSRGMLWVGANGHLSVWDGRRLTEPELPLAKGDQVERLLFSRSNELAFATAQGCVLYGRLPAQGDYQWTSSRPTGLSQFAVDARGQIWQLTPNGRLWRVIDLQRDAVQIPNTAGRINQIVADQAGRIWLGAEHQLLMQDGNRFDPVTPPTDEQAFAVTKLFPATDGALEVVANGRLWRLRNYEWRLNPGAWTVHRWAAKKRVLHRLWQV